MVDEESVPSDDVDLPPLLPRLDDFEEGQLSSVGLEVGMYVGNEVGSGGITVAGLAVLRITKRKEEHEVSRKKVKEVCKVDNLIQQSKTKNSRAVAW